MKAILYISVISFIVFFLNGCTHKEPPPEFFETKVVIKKTCPKMTILKPIPKKFMNIPKVKIKFKRTDNPNEVIVSIIDLKMGSESSQKKDFLIAKQKRYLTFYENQIKEVRKVCSDKKLEDK